MPPMGLLILFIYIQRLFNLMDIEDQNKENVLNKINHLIEDETKNLNEYDEVEEKII